MNFNKFYKSFIPFSSIKCFASSIYFVLLIILFLILIIQSCHSQSSNSKIIYDTIYVNQKKPLIKLTVDLVRVDSAYGTLTGDKMIDGIPAFVNGTQTNSRWAVEGYPHCAIFYFSKIVSIDVN